MGTTAVQSAPETRELCSPVDGYKLSTETPIQTEFRNAEELRAEYDSINNQLETAKDLIENKVYPLLVRMQAILSQRGSEHLRREANLPTWTEYYESFRLKFKLPCLRMFQRRKLVLAGGASAQGKRPAAKKGPRFNTGAGLCDHPGMLTDLLDQIERHGDKVPQPIRNTAAEYRRILNANPKVVVPRVTMPSQKAIEKGIAQIVSKAVKCRRGKLIAI